MKSNLLLVLLVCLVWPTIGLPQNCPLGFAENICIDYSMKMVTSTVPGDRYDIKLILTNRGSDRLQVSLGYKVGGTFGDLYHVKETILEPGAKKVDRRNFLQVSARDRDPDIEIKSFSVRNLSEEERKRKEGLAQEAAEEELFRQSLGTVVITTDILVDIRWNDELLGILEPGQNFTFGVPKGDHRLGIVPAAAPDKLIEETVTVKAQAQVNRQIKLRPVFGALEDKRIAAEKIEQQKRESQQKASDRAAQYEAELARKKRDAEQRKVVSVLPRKYIKQDITRPEQKNAPELGMTPQNISFNENNMVVVSGNTYRFFGDSVISMSGDKYYHADFLARLREDRKRQFLSNGFVNGTYPNGSPRSEWFGWIGKVKIWFTFFENGTVGVYVETKKFLGTKAEEANGTWKLNGTTIEVVADGDEIGLVMLEFIPGRLMQVEGADGPIELTFVRLHER